MLGVRITCLMHSWGWGEGVEAGMGDKVANTGEE